MIAFLQSVHDTLTADPVITNLCGEPLRLYLDMAPDSPPFPYAVQALAVELQDDGIILEGFLLIDIWWNSFDAAKALLVATQIKSKLHHATDAALCHAGLEFRGMGTVNTDNEEVKRVAMRFRVDIPDLDLALAAG